MKRYLLLILLISVPTSVFGLDVDTSSVNDALDVQYGGTDATTAGAARANLGLVIGTDVQAYDSNLPSWPATVDATEVGYLNGVTSALQTQLDAKEGTLTNEAGLYSALSDVTDFVQTGEIDTLAELETVSSGGAYMSDILAATSEANLKSIVNLEIGTDVQAYDSNLPSWPATVDATEVGYLNGVTSALQTQIDGKEDTLTNSAGLAGAISDESGTGVVVFNVGPNLQDQVLFTGTAVDDDDCTGDQGKMWWDSTDTQFEFCNDNSGTPIVVGSGSGGSATVEDDAYTAAWDTDVDGTSKNTLYDYLVQFDADADGSFTDEAWFPSATGAPTDVPYYVTTADAGLSAEVVVPAFIQGIMDDTDEATFKATVNLEIGTDVQAYDANLITWPATVDATEVGYLNGLSDSLTTLLAAKEGTLTNEAGLYAALSDVTNFLQTGDTLDAADMTFDDTGAIITATTVEGALQENRTAIDLNTAKETNTDDQTIDVLSFNGTNLSISLEGDGEATQTVDLTSVSTDDQTATEVNIADSGAIITATTVEGALQENRTAIDLNTAKTTNATHTGDVTGATALTIATGAVAADELAATTVTAGSYSNADITVDADGRITAAADGSGSVSGAGSSTDNAFPRFDGTGGASLQNGQTTEDDSGNVTIAGNLDVGGLITQDPTASPSYTFNDSDSPGTDKEAAQLSAQYVDGADGAENADLTFSVMQGGSRTSVIVFDESDDRWETTKEVLSTGGFTGDLSGTADNADALSVTGRAAVETYTNKDLSSGTNTFPSWDTADITADAVDGTLIANDAVDSEHYAAASIDNEHLADSAVDTAEIAADAVEGTKIADDQIDSEHYAAASIDNEHLADDAVGTDELSNTLDIVTTGTIQGDVKVTNKAGNATLAASEMNGMVFVSAAATMTLPAVSVGTSVCVYSTGANEVSVDANASDRIRLDGTALDDGDKVTSASAAGDFICFLGDSAAGWTTLGRSGTWTDGGP